MTKICIGCGKDKPLSDYYDHYLGKLGKLPRCKACVKISRIKRENKKLVDRC